ncbi:hypothetical protein [Actinoplanes sp. M2I2]|uniref:hypothetical protein n=1 Tax=Actinoplanes sp. M2I2 TaxID=1734444 RepID=UPI00201FD786|nr:hypothetical protein [Actinoplanes sp. M2I2]
MTEHAPAKPWSGIDITKTLAGTLAAVSAAVIGSFLGVAGTLIGAAVASLIGSVGTELYQRWLQRGSQRIKSTFVTAPAAVGTPSVEAAHEVPSEETAPAALSAPVKMHWGRIAAAAGTLFVLAMGSLTAFELISGKSVPAAVGHKTSSSTTLGSAFSGDNGSRDRQEGTTTPSESPSTEPDEGSESADPTATPSTEPTVTPTTSPTQPAEPQQTDGVDPGTTPTDEPTGTGEDTTQQDGTTGDGSGQDGSQLNDQQIQPDDQQDGE